VTRATKSDSSSKAGNTTTHDGNVEDDTLARKHFFFGLHVWHVVANAAVYPAID